MRALARSMIRWPLAAPLLGAEQLRAAWLRRGDGGDGDGACDRLGSSLDALAWTGHRRLGLMLQMAFQTGDDLGREWADTMAGLLAGGDRQPVGALAGRLVSTAGAVARIATPGPAGGVARQELRNKFEVYWLVRRVRARLGLPPAGEPFALAPFVTRAAALDDYSALWVIEGLGHDYAIVALRAAPQATGILTALELPPRSFLMLHAGLGLALAEHVLDTLPPERASDAEAAAAVARFARLCRANARDGFADAALEALGLVARCFYPDLVPALGRAVSGDALLEGYFWHGVGRAIYFLPVNFLPGYGTIAHAIDMALREAPEERAAGNAVAGVAYAVAMVNLSHPAVLEHLLRERGEALVGSQLSEGLASALLMRRATTPQDPALGSFLRYRPDAAEPALADLWRRLIAEPVAAAFQAHDDAVAGGDNGPLGPVYRALVAAGGPGAAAPGMTTEAAS